VFAKIDSSYERQIYEGCINDAKLNNDYNSASKKFCKCYANQFDKKFNNEQLLKFLNKSQQEQAKIVNNEISPSCYPATKKTQKINDQVEINCILSDGLSSMWLIDEKNKIIERDGVDLSDSLDWSVLRWNEKIINVYYKFGTSERWDKNYLRLDRTTGIMVIDTEFKSGYKFRHFYKCELAEAPKF
jgi:hypothetical protein